MYKQFRTFFKKWQVGEAAHRRNQGESRENLFFRL
jgi:hypothetical protein